MTAENYGLLTELVPFAFIGIMTLILVLVVCVVSPGMIFDTPGDKKQ